MAKAKSGFEKFMNPEPKPAAKKEAYRAEKRKAKADARAAGEAYRQEKKARAQGWSTQEPRGQNRPAGQGTQRPARTERTPPRDERPARRDDRAEKSVDKRPKPGAGRPYERRDDAMDMDREKADLKQWADNFVQAKPEKGARPFVPSRSSDGRFTAARQEEKRSGRYEDHKAAGRGGEKPFQKADAPAFAPKTAKAGRDHDWAQKRISRKPGKTERSQAETQTAPASAEEMPLNKFIAHAGICGRREAADMVKAGKATVNGDIVYEPGYKVSEADDVRLNGKKLQKQVNLQYILLNKPKDYITTMKDPEGRKTVLELVKDAAKQRIYPVGRLDRNTTGVLLLTNDGDLAQKLTHPSFQVKKIYEVKLDKVLSRNDFDAILQGVELEDGVIMADSLAYADSKDKSIIGIEIHSGKNRIVRRLFEHLGYDVRNLDRVMFANLTKKNVERGTWRFLKEKEVRNLKFLNSSFTRK